MTSPPAQRMPLPEFIGLMGLLFAMVALSIDAILPGLGLIAQELSPDDPNRAQLLITSFVLGLGIGTFFTGPLSDTFGRKPTVVVGSALYILCAFVAWTSSSLEVVLGARLLQGAAAAGPRIAATAIVRDLYQGRQMARILSFCMIVFTLVPAIAPLIGDLVMHAFGWRAIFLMFILFSFGITSWFFVRQPETLAPENRRAFRISALLDGTKEILRTRLVVLTIFTLGLVFGTLFTTISTIQPTFDAFGWANSFALWFGAIAVVSGGAGFLNAALVVRLGMRRVTSVSLVIQVAFSALMIILSIDGVLSEEALFAAYVLWIISLFCMATLTIGNLNSLGMEPLGHLAGLGASLISALATIIAVAVAVPIGLAFDGTPLPAAIGLTLCTAAAALLMRAIGPEATPASPPV